MKPNDHSLDRLLRSAGNAVPHAADEVPFGFATRVVSGWLAAGPGDVMGLQTLWFRRSLLGALAVMLLSVGWSYKTDTAAPNEEMAIATYATPADLQ
jgi:hypothetical protein